MTAERPMAVAPVACEAPWIPCDMVEQVPAGVEFDAVRVAGLLGFEVAVALDIATGQRSGAVILDDPHAVNEKAELYFLVPAGEGIARSWPPGIRVYGFPTQMIRVPALSGPTLPLRWRSRPTHDAVLVDAELLHRALCDITTWSPLSDSG